METQVRTPQLVFIHPQRLMVPLFQRPYVWNEESQWEPLWNDVVRVAERLLQHPHAKHQPHFLGAVVFQQVQNPVGHMQSRTIIDGQQRLTTLQLLLDALHQELLAVQATAPAARIEQLVANAAPFCSRPEDRFKVWPTNRDRPAFNDVMAAEPPIDYEALGHRGEKIAQAHRFFSEQAREWLNGDGAPVELRAATIETVVREHLQMVVIDLAADENAQEIFETLNARGAQLTAADLIKNFIFQRLSESDADVERAYQQYWRDFETGFWEGEISLGRVRYPRSSVFLNHWLISRTGEEIVAREVFERFKSFADHDAGMAMPAVLQQIHRASAVYRDFVMSATRHNGPADRLALFAYRTGVLESEVIKPLVLWFFDPEQPPIPEDQLRKALEILESWMVRRMLVRATTKNYGQLVADLVNHLRAGLRSSPGDAIEEFLAGQKSDSKYWPDDREVAQELESLLAYRRLGRGRLRMVLEAIEDHLRGWRGGEPALGGERVARAQYAIEHIMPRKWAGHWPLSDAMTEVERDRLIHTLGNLTLLTGKLNSKVSNGPWVGDDGKRQALNAHDVLILNRRIVEEREWNDEKIRIRTQQLARVITEIWPVPQGHRSDFARARPRLRRKVQLVDLISGGALAPGIALYPRRKKYSGRVAVLLSDGGIELDDVTHASPSEAASAITGHATNGWAFFVVDQHTGRTLRAVRRDYVTTMALEADTEEDDGDDDSDDAGA